MARLLTSVACKQHASHKCPHTQSHLGIAHGKLESSHDLVFALHCAGQTDLNRRQVKIKRAEAKPIGMDDITTSMNSGLGIQQASPQMEDEDEYHAKRLQTQFELARILAGRTDDGLARGCCTPLDQGIKLIRRTENTD